MLLREGENSMVFTAELLMFKLLKAGMGTAEVKCQRQLWFSNLLMKSTVFRDLFLLHDCYHWPKPSMVFIRGSANLCNVCARNK